MSIKLLFEDGNNTPSSLLLKQSKHGNNIYFSDGSSRILKKLLEIKTSTDTVYIFYDVVPNNKSTLAGYDALINIIKENPLLYSNTYVIPIICVEYYLCKLFYNYKYFYCTANEINDLVSAIVETFDYGKVSQNIKKHKRLGNSLEKIYKYIISNQKMVCLHNEEKQKKPLCGIFYKRSCACERTYCKINCTDNISLKAERFYTSLPMFVVDTDEHKQLLKEFGITISSTDNEKIQKDCQLLYDKICNSMGIATINIIL